MKVKVVYRNYIPLYSTYSSFWLSPMKGVEFIIPKPKKYLKTLYKIYHLISSGTIVKFLLSIFQGLIFDSKPEEGVDLLFYVGMLPDEKVKIPYVIDLEHPIILFGGVKPTKLELKKVLKILTNKLCVGIVPWSKAAAETLEKYFGKDYAKFRKKVKVLYPALPSYIDKYGSNGDDSLLGKKGKKFRTLFVAGLGHRKGLSEVLEAYDTLSQKYKNLEFVIVTNSEDLISSYRKNKSFKFYKANIPHSEIIPKIFLNCDLFVMPTYGDTFGMVYFEAMSAGLPIVLTKQFATAEMIKDGVEGRFLKHKKLYLDREIYPKRSMSADEFISKDERINITKEVIDKVSYFVEHPAIHKRMSKNAAKLFKKGGKFSLAERNKILEKIFKSHTNERK